LRARPELFRRDADNVCRNCAHHRPPRNATALHIYQNTGIGFCPYHARFSTYMSSISIGLP